MFPADVCFRADDVGSVLVLDLGGFDVCPTAMKDLFQRKVFSFFSLFFLLKLQNKMFVCFFLLLLFWIFPEMKKQKKGIINPSRDC